jgi:epoxyqueuosine reductase
LTLFATDLPCEKDTWQDIQVLHRCATCKACQKNCPTKAISDKSTVIQAERCLAYFNEQPGNFPEWLDPASHNSIVGCMKCQSICPENIKYKSALVYHDEFSEEESSMILKGVSYELLPEKLRVKINDLCLKHYYAHLSRNIAALVRDSPKKSPRMGLFQ